MRMFRPANQKEKQHNYVQAEQTDLVYANARDLIQKGRI